MNLKLSKDSPTRMAHRSIFVKTLLMTGPIENGLSALTKLVATVELLVIGGLSRLRLRL